MADISDKNDLGETKTCPFCGETILAVATKCKHCREYLESPPHVQHARSPGDVRDVIPADDDRPRRIVDRPHYVGSTFRRLHSWYNVGHALSALLLLIGLALIIVAFSVGAIRSYEDRLLVWLIAGGGTIVLTLVPGLLGAVMFFILLYKSWNMIQDGHARTDAFKAVALMFVPYFNYYWIFVAIRGLTVDMNAYIQRHGLSVRPASVKIATTYCILLLCGIVPVLGILALLVVQCVFVFLVGSTIAKTAAAIADAEAIEPVQPRARFPWAYAVASVAVLLFLTSLGIGLYLAWPAHAARSNTLPTFDDSCLAVSADGKTVVGGTKRGSLSWDLKVWERPSADATIPNAPVRTIHLASRHYLAAPALSPDGKYVAMVTQNEGGKDGNFAGGLTVWNIRTGEKSLELPGGEPGADGGLDCVAFSPDGRRLASGWMDGDFFRFPPQHKIRIRDAQSGEVIQTLEGHADVICSLAFNGDGTRLVSGCYDGTIKLWDLESGAELNSFTSSPTSLLRVAIDSTGKHVAACDGRSIKVWDAKTGKSVIDQRNSDDSACLAFSPDGRYLATAGKQVQIWDIAAQKVVTSLHTGFFAGFRNIDLVTYSKDGKHIIAAGGRDTWTWNVDD